MTENPDNVESVPPRRSLLTGALAVVFGTICGVVPVIAGALTALDPLRRRSASSGTFLPATPLAAVPDNGAPRRCDIRADLTDAWNRFPNALIGAVYVRRVKPGDDGIVAYSTVCPHAGCFVDTKSDQSEAGWCFKCPCHDSEFNPDGSRRPFNAQGRQTVSPRDMDTLEVKIENGTVLVKFEKYRTGSGQKVVQG